MLRRITLAAMLITVAACQDEAPTTAAPTDAEGLRSILIGRLASRPLELTLLHNNDGESELVPDGEVGGVARFSALVDDLRDEGEDCEDRRTPCGVILVSSGDNFLAGTQFNASLELPEMRRFYDAVALDRIDYDAIAIGNHEFDFGPDVLADFISDFRPGWSGWRAQRRRFVSRRFSSLEEEVFLSSNLVFAGEPRLAELEARGKIAASTVVEVDRVPVGIIGATTSALPTVSSPRNVVVLQDVAGAINAEVAKLEAEGVESIILISHLQSLEEDRALVGMLAGVDIVVAGGGDELLANSDTPLLPGDSPSDDYPVYARDLDGEDVPVVTTSGGYRYVGRLKVRFEDGRIAGIDAGSGPVRVYGPDGIGTDRFLEAFVERPVEQSRAGLAANMIGTSAVALDGLRANVRTIETNQGNLVADAQLALARSLGGQFGISPADVAVQNGGGMRDDEIVPPGPISELKTFDILPFANVLSVVEGVSRARFKEVLENAVSRVEFADGRFAQIAGFRFEWDPAGTAQTIDVASGLITQAGTRVVSVTLDDGTPIVADGSVVPGADLAVATINFLAAGGDQYPLVGLPSTNLGLTYQQVLETYIEDPAFLGGVVSAADYPEGGEGRIIRR